MSLTRETLMKMSKDVLAGVVLDLTSLNFVCYK